MLSLGNTDSHDDRDVRCNEHMELISFLKKSSAVIIKFILIWCLMQRLRLVKDLIRKHWWQQERDKTFEVCIAGSMGMNLTNSETVIDRSLACYSQWGCKSHVDISFYAYILVFFFHYLFEKFIVFVKVYGII